MHIVRMFEESFFAILFQWTNNKDIRLYANNKKILSTFKNLLGTEISILVKKKDNELLDTLYKENFESILETNNLSKVAKKNFTKDDITDGNVISFPMLGDKNNPWDKTLTSELIEAYQKLGWKQVESYELDPYDNWPHNEDALMFVKLKEGFVPKEPEYEDDEDYRDF